MPRCHRSFRERTFPPCLFLQGCSQRSAKASSLVRARRVVTKLTKGNSSPALAVTVLPLQQTTTKLALGDVGEVFRSLHGSFNDDLEMKCCRNLSALLSQTQAKFGHLTVKATSIASRTDKAVPRQVSTLLEGSAEHRLPVCTLASVPPVTLGTTLQSEQIPPEQQFYSPPPC